MPIATSLCPDEVGHHADDAEDDADADDEEVEDILPWSSSVYFPVHFPQLYRSMTLISLSGKP